MKCSTYRLAAMAVGFVSFSVLAASSFSAPVVFFDRDDTTQFMTPTKYPNSEAKFNQFTALISPGGLDPIDGDTPGANPVLTFGGSGITAASQGVIANNNPGFEIGSQSLVETDAAVANAPAVDTVFVFNQHITAFGTYVLQGGDGANSNPTNFRLTDTDTNYSVDVPIQMGPGWGFDNAFFVGIANAIPFNKVSILESTDAADGMLYDNIVAGHFIPEPTALVLLTLGGALAAGGSSRNRRH